MARERSLLSAGNLVRSGFQDSDRAGEQLRSLGEAAEPLVSLLARTADPDLALETLIRLHTAAPDADVLLSTVAEDEGTAMRLLSVLGLSAALGEHLVRHPEHWRELTDPTLGSTRPPAYAVRAGLRRRGRRDPAATAPVAGLPPDAAADALRVEYRRVLLRLASRDLAHHIARRGRRRRAGRPGRRHAGGGPGRRPCPGRSRRVAAAGSPSSRWASAAATS